MPDAGTIAADKAQKELESRIKTIYGKARKDVSAKLKAHTAAFKAKDKQKRAQVKAGLISKQDYADWKQGQVFTGKMWQDKLNSIEYTLLHAAEQVNDIVEGQKLAIFGENATYMAYRFSKDTGLMSAFNVYDAATVTRLVKEQPELLPRKEINGVKQDAWERKKISNRVASGIVSGESIEEIAKGIADETALTDEKAAVRYARTAMTSAQNAGRVVAMKDAQAIGINVEKLWIATLDAHTRDAHAHLDGQTAKVNEPFISKLGEIDYPGDPFASPANVYNCRCTLGYHYPEYSDYSKMERIARYEKGDQQYEPGHRNYETVQGMTYEKWVEHKQEQIRQRYGSGDEIFTQKDAYTESEKEAIHEYTTSSYSGVNSALRDGTVENYESVKRIVNEIDSAMEKTIVREGTVASRGASMADLRGMFEDKRRSWFEDPDNLKSLEGQISTFKSYISTTKGESVAEPYKRELQWHFTTEGNVHGIDAEQFASSSVKAEREILFDRKSLIEIEKVKVNIDSDGDIYGVVEIWAKIKPKS